MDKQSIYASNMSVDSLEAEFHKKIDVRDKHSAENVDTILVPFYENDVLIKVPKGQNKKQENKHSRKEENRRKSHEPNSYLVNKHKLKSTSNYLDMFRKQFTPGYVEKKEDRHEIRSLSPEYGDTERESIGEDVNNPTTEFYNTEAYNEIYYEKLLSEEKYLDYVLDQKLHFHDDQSKSPDYSLKSVSEVSHHGRHLRRTTAQPVVNIKLGGLGPDMEKIKPRLQRARSLQRYSEKVRMANRVKIYKKSVLVDTEKKRERELSAPRRCSDRHMQKESKESPNASYLVNKSVMHENKNTRNIKNANEVKSKSADVIQTNNRLRDKIIKSARMLAEVEDNADRTDKREAPKASRGQEVVKVLKNMKDEAKERIKSSCSRNRRMSPTEKQGSDKAPVQINFLVNVGGVRPSSALRSLEEKHRMYQERVKAFTMDLNE